MKITDPKLLHELYDIEAEHKLLIGYRFKGCLPAARGTNGPSAAPKRRPLTAGKARKRTATARRRSR